MIFESLKLQRLLLDMDKGILKISDLELGRTYTMPLKSYTHEIAILWFHLLGEFDEGKRNCRKRLDGHNRRRRKPQLEPMSCSGSFLSNYQGAQLLPFSSSCVYPSTTVVNPTWAGVVKTESDPGLHNQHLQHQNMFLGSSTSSRYNKGSGNKQKFTLFQSSCSNQRAAHAASVCQPLLNTISMSETASASSAKSKMFCDRLITIRIHPDSDSLSSVITADALADI